MAHTLLVGIVALDRAAATERCIRSIRETASVPTRLIVADNGSQSHEAQSLLERLATDGIAEVLRLPENRGPSGGKNAILAAAGGEPYVALLDNDITALPGWDAAAIRSIREGAALVQPKLLEPDLAKVDRGPNSPNPDPLNANPLFAGRGEGRSNPVVSALSEVAIVGCGIASAEVFEKVGGFDEILRIGVDYDLSARAAREGLKLVFDPGCELVHDHGFDLSYDSRRGDLSGILNSFSHYWFKHGKCLLCPRYFGWYSWLASRGEPMFLPPFSGKKMIWRRARRRAARAWFMAMFPRRWSGASMVEGALARAGYRPINARS